MGFYSDQILPRATDVIMAAKRLTPIQRRLAGGCHLNRPIQALIEASGLELAKIANYHLQGPKAFGYMHEGVAAKP